MKNNAVKKLVTMGMLAALSIALAYLVHFPIFPSAAYLEYDMADIPILIGSFMFGPISGLILTAIVAVIQGVTVSAQSGWVGIVMHFIATGALAITVGTIYRLKSDRVGAVLALVAGTLVMTALMIPLNLIFTVHFNGVPREAVVAMLGPIIIPFNLIKAGVNSVLAFGVFKALSGILGIGRKKQQGAA